MSDLLTKKELKSLEDLEGQLTFEQYWEAVEYKARVKNLLKNLVAQARKQAKEQAKAGHAGSPSLGR